MSNSSGIATNLSSINKQNHMWSYWGFWDQGGASVFTILATGMCVVDKSVPIQQQGLRSPCSLVAVHTQMIPPLFTFPYSMYSKTWVFSFKELREIQWSSSLHAIGVPIFLPPVNTIISRSSIPKSASNLLLWGKMLLHRNNCCLEEGGHM